ncbi:MAG: hypothetical protein U0K60_05890 [Parafannyhessea umbonata]|nr:hypothetical protein [Parafannyhessea umbonata]
MDLRITLDITERFAAALNALASTIQSVSIQTAPAPISEPFVYSVEIPNAQPAQPAQTAPESAAEAEPVVIPPEPEASPTETVQPQETAIAETPANDDTPIAEPAPEKPKKKKASKKPVEAPEPASEPEAPVIQPTPEPAPAAPTAPQETTKSDGDPMAGMTVVDAVQALVSEIQDKGIDMASVNARVRAKANEIGLTYASAACLIKAIGYVEARRVALGEK